MYSWYPMIYFAFRYYVKTTPFKGMGVFPFSIDSLYKDIQQRCPSLCATMLAAVKPSLWATAAPRIVAAASILLQTRSKQCNAFQKLISLLLWKGQCKSLVSLTIFWYCEQQATRAAVGAQCLFNMLLFWFDDLSLNISYLKTYCTGIHYIVL